MLVVMFPFSARVIVFEGRRRSTAIISFSIDLRWFQDPEKEWHILSLANRYLINTRYKHTDLCPCINIV